MNSQRLMYLDSQLSILGCASRIIQADEILHHFGNFDPQANKLGQPLWVSDDFLYARQYENFGDPLRYTKFSTIRPLTLARLEVECLQPIAEELGVYHHFDWNKLLARYVSDAQLDGFVYMRHELFVASPAECLLAH